MDISSYNRNGSTIIVVVGRIDAVTSAELSKWLDEEITPPEYNVILDCSEVNYVSSAGLRVMLQLTKLAKQNGVAFSLCRPQENLREVLDISGFSELFPIHADLDQAVLANND